MTLAAAPDNLALAREMESERTRWLRRRFVWYCGTVMTLSAALTAVMYYASRFDPSAKLTGLNWVETFVNLAFHALACVYVVRQAPSRKVILRIALILSVASLAVTLATTHADMGSWIGEDTVTTDPAQAAADANGAWAVAAPFMILFSHFLACVFIPWRLMESLFTGLAMLGVYAVFLAVLVTTGRLGRDAFWIIPFASLAIVPGGLVCWWRFSKFATLFRLRFESARYRMLQAELSGARRIHESCLPAARETGAVRFAYAYEPMRQIGGDLIFFHPPAGGVGASIESLSAVILDVTGHGIAAALTVNRLVGELERKFAENPSASPGEVLSALNQYVFLTLAKHSIFATAMSVRVNIRDNTLTYASGGHPTGFVRGVDGSVTMLESTTFMLGVVGGAEFEPEEKVVAFGEGDALLLYTDGAAEARDARGRMLETAGILELFKGTRGTSPQVWPGEILEGVTQYREDAPAEDDTLIAAIYRPV